jgi:hypothetical protein
VSKRQRVWCNNRGCSVQPEVTEGEDDASEEETEAWAAASWNTRAVPASAVPEVSDSMVETALRVHQGEDWPSAYTDYEIGVYRISMRDALVAALGKVGES